MILCVLSRTQFMKNNWKTVKVNSAYANFKMLIFGNKSHRNLKLVKKSDLAPKMRLLRCMDSSFTNSMMLYIDSRKHLMKNNG